ncbi:MAG TPA: hypothetical protein VM425_15755 [Myxococcota bacterium]|nr:hypothetical protein [Myxococcota bacterium]
MKKIIAATLTALFLAAGPASAAPKKKKAGSVRVYRFDNLDIEGHVKTPHLMYFLKRIRNKFRSFRLPAQHFEKKIIKSRKADFLD